MYQWISRLFALHTIAIYSKGMVGQFVLCLATLSIFRIVSCCPEMLLFFVCSCHCVHICSHYLHSKFIHIVWWPSRSLAWSSGLYSTSGFARLCAIVSRACSWNLYSGPEIRTLITLNTYSILHGSRELSENQIHRGWLM